MSRNDYRKIAEERINENQVATESVDIDTISNDEVEEVIDTPKSDIYVVDCQYLNVRKEASKRSEVVCVLNKGTELLVDEAESTNEWLKVCAPGGAEGYCMRQFCSKK